MTLGSFKGIAVVDTYFGDFTVFWDLDAVIGTFTSPDMLFSLVVIVFVFPFLTVTMFCELFRLSYIDTCADSLFCIGANWISLSSLWLTFGEVASRY